MDTTSWSRSAKSLYAGDTTWASYRSSMCARRVSGLGVEIAMVRFRSCGLPSTICSARDGCFPWGIQETGVLVETLLDRGTDADVAEAEAAIQRLATAPPADRRSGDTRASAAATTSPPGAGSRRRGPLSRIPGSLPRDGENAWLRGAHEVGRGDAMTVAGLVCASCGTELPSDSKFCNKCGTPVGVQHSPAEYKQVTVLFADVVQFDGHCGGRRG